VPSESHKTVYVALAANAAIGVCNVAAGVVSGSSAMLAEAAHSVADTTNQLLLTAAAAAAAAAAARAASRSPSWCSGWA
jgi:divalent metal cation (Fe/Co/Zn/Cd) transporter